MMRPIQPRSTLCAVAIGAALTLPACGAPTDQDGAATSASDPYITTADLEAGLSNPERWLTYSGDYNGQRHGPLTEITPANVGDLIPLWTFETGVQGKFEATPVVLDGVMYITEAEDFAWALDARTGEEIWSYERDLPDGLLPCCGRVNRGFAISGDKLLMMTLDAHLVALDRATGAVVYDVEVDDYRLSYTGTLAPLVVGDKVIVGISGAEYGVRGFLDAFYIETGEKAWRFWTVPSPGEPGSETWAGDSWVHGGAPTWVTGSYDPELNLVYWGTGNPAPDYDGGARLGDNLYSNTLLALNPDTGELVWHYQFTPHDTHDWDSNHVPVLADLSIDGVDRRVVMVADRNGFFYMLDRTNGELLVAEPFVHTTWATEIGDDGRPIVLPNTEPTEEGVFACPHLYGGTNWMSPSFSPATELFYVTIRETCGVFFQIDDEYVVGERYTGGTVRRAPPDAPEQYGGVRALDPRTGEMQWEFRYGTPSMAGVMSTASGLVFSGDLDGFFRAFDAGTGEVLWQTRVPDAVYSGPTSFEVDGRQVVAIPAGETLTVFGLPGG